MTHENWLQHDERETVRERLKESPQEETMMQPPPKIFARTKGSITIDLPPVTLPTPSAIAKRLMASPIVWYSMMLLIGFTAGSVWHARPAVPTVPPDPVITVTETLADFAARESTVLSAEERQKLTAVTAAVLGGHYETPADIREEFRFQRLKAGIDSPAFKTFSENWSAKVTEMKVEESVESVREVYRELLAGLQGSVRRSQESEVRREEPEAQTPDSSPLSPDSSPTQRTRLFRRR